MKKLILSIFFMLFSFYMFCKISFFDMYDLTADYKNNTLFVYSEETSEREYQISYMIQVISSYLHNNNITVKNIYVFVGKERISIDVEYFFSNSSIQQRSLLRNYLKRK